VVQSIGAMNESATVVYYHNTRRRITVPRQLAIPPFDPFALLACTVLFSSRGLPVALTTYHREDLAACFPPRPTSTDKRCPALSPANNPPIFAHTRQDRVRQDGRSGRQLSLL
jgi:hypothetical protein